MKLFTLTESSIHHKISNETYDIELYLSVDRGETSIITTYIEVDVNDYNKVTSNLKDTVRDVLQEIYSVVVSNQDINSVVVSQFPQNDKGYIGIGELKFVDRLQGGGSTILIGKDLQILSVTRQILIDIEEPEEDIEEIVNSVKSINFPTKEECMTRLERDHRVTKAATRKYDVKDINVELTLNPKIGTVVNILLNSTPENEDEESVGFALAKILKPYKIRPQINGGSIIGVKD
jgi:hypothetical protein